MAICNIYNKKILAQAIFSPSGFRIVRLRVFSIDMSTTADVIDTTVCVFPWLQMPFSANQTHEEFLEALNKKVTEAPLNDRDLSMLTERLQLWKEYDTKCGIYSGATKERREWILEELKAAMRFAARVHEMTKYNSGDPFGNQHMYDIEEKHRIVEQYEMFDEAKALLESLDPDWAKSVNADNVNKKKCCHIQ